MQVLFDWADATPLRKHVINTKRITIIKLFLIIVSISPPARYP